VLRRAAAVTGRVANWPRIGVLIAALVLAPACGGDDDEAASTTHVLNLVVSNQSFYVEDVRIVVTIDNEEVLDQDFAVEGQHNFVPFELSLTAGEHVLRAEAPDESTLFEVTFDLPDERWASIFFWRDPSAPGQFTWNLSDKPMAFD
jgi:hypothetical protein